MKTNHTSMRSLIWSIIFGCALYFSIGQWGVKIAVVRGKSMEPTYHDGDKVFINCYKKLFGSPKKGDVIVCIDPEDGGLDIKRVILTPGELDTISPTRSHQYLKEDEYVILGDNRANSCDSRIYGPIKKKSIIGIVE